MNIKRIIKFARKIFPIKPMRGITNLASGRKGIEKSPLLNHAKGMKNLNGWKHEQFPMKIENMIFSKSIEKCR